MEPPTCSTCGGIGNYLGQLGNLIHFRCRQCGMQFSIDAPEPDDDQDDDDEE